jgi:ribose/xylose/arabinose/galactoside ABC-type transport system permease subunit
MSYASKLKDVSLDREQVILKLFDNISWPILLITVLVFSVMMPESFLTYNNFEFLIYSSAALGVIVLAESLCLISGNFDLSVGSVAGFSGMFTALALTSWFPGLGGIEGILLILFVGAFLGFLNGFSVAYLGVNPFLQTLAFFIIFRSAVTMLSTRSISGLPDLYLFIGGANVLGIPFAIIFVFAIYGAVWFWLNYMRSGIALYSIGGNEESAREAGINTKFLVMLVFVISGTLSALGGLLFTGFLGAATTTLAQNTVFPAFAAAVIGGISLTGGRGNVLNAFGGVLLLASVESGLVMMRVEANMVNTINGIILLCAIFLFTFGERYRARVLST